MNRMEIEHCIVNSRLDGYICCVSICRSAALDLIVHRVQVRAYNHPWSTDITLTDGVAAERAEQYLELQCEFGGKLVADEGLKRNITG